MTTRGSAPAPADRVDLAVHLLQQEAHAPRPLVGRLDGGPELLEMARQAHTLFGDVGAIGQDSNLLRQTRLVDCRAFEQFVQTPSHAIARFLGHYRKRHSQ